MASPGLRPSRLTSAAVVALVSAVLLALGAPVALAAPATPTTLPAAIEDLQPYVGQSVCDPVAKPGVRAFSDLLLNTYRDTSSLGITRDCGIGGQSEHKEGRAFDWGVSAANPTHVKHVNEVLAWLMATDKYGNKMANLRRLGIMYIIWNRHIWKAYQPSAGWQPYSGESAHTDHVHFSFGWNGARKVTSFWDGTVAPIDWGPKGPIYPVIKPVAVPANLPVLASYGDLTVARGSTGEAVKVVQRVLKITADGVFGSGTEGAVRAFQSQQHRTVTGKVAPGDWLALFPKPTSPFGALETTDPDFASTRVSGWAIDADQDAPVDVEISADGLPPLKVSTDQLRPDITKTYVRYTSTHGFTASLVLLDGPHTICVKALNIVGTPGTTTTLECRKITVDHTPIGALDKAVQGPGGILAAGWALDPDTADPIDVALTVDGKGAPGAVANLERADLLNRFPGYGGRHAFSALIPVAAGTHTVCATALNALESEGAPTAALGCRTLLIRSAPVGSLSIASIPGSVHVKGIAIDPDTAAASLVQISVDGAARPTLIAGATVPPIAGWTPFGNDHGFETDLVLANGSHTVCVTALNVVGTPGSNTALGCKPVAVAHDAQGAFELLQLVPGTVATKGWAVDPDRAEPSAYRFDIDGVRGTPVATDVIRPDLALPGLGQVHGFAPQLAFADGVHKVCATALNTVGTPGVDKALGCRSVTVRHSPQGVLNPLRRVPTGIYVSGWALDTDVATPVTVQVTLDGRAVVQGGASRLGTTWTAAAASFPGFTGGHGFWTTLAMPAGTHTICAIGQNLGEGAASTLGCRSVVVTNTPVAAITGLTRGRTSVSVAGWALDPDSTGALTVHLRLDGHAVSVVRAYVASSAFATAHPGYGPNHLFVTSLAMMRGVHTLCASADNASGTPGTASAWACRTVTV